MQRYKNSIDKYKQEQVSNISKYCVHTETFKAVTDFVCLSLTVTWEVGLAAYRYQTVIQIWDYVSSEIYRCMWCGITVFVPDFKGCVAVKWWNFLNLSDSSTCFNSCCGGDLAKGSSNDIFHLKRATDVPVGWNVFRQSSSMSRRDPCLRWFIFHYSQSKANIHDCHAASLLLW